MPAKGGKNKKRKNRKSDGGNDEKASDEMIYKIDTVDKDGLFTSGQCYATVIKILGGDHMQVKTEDGETRVCKIRGKNRRGRGNEFSSAGGFVIVSLRGGFTISGKKFVAEYDNGKCDLVYQYRPKMTRRILEQLSAEAKQKKNVDSGKKKSDNIDDINIEEFIVFSDKNCKNFNEDEGSEDSEDEVISKSKIKSVVEIEVEDEDPDIDNI
jgi:hypothetical protein